MSIVCFTEGIGVIYDKSVLSIACMAAQKETDFAEGSS
jgi:hypothetical protein